MKLEKINLPISLPKDKKILIYGFGNPGRQDDGLGFQFVKILEEKGHSNLDFDFNYQLNIEDASNIASYDIIVFVDASLRISESFSFAPLFSEAVTSYSTHAISPVQVLDLCQQIFHVKPDCYLLEIKGYEWELNEGLTIKSQAGLLQALEYFESIL
jgi:hydrogenase maturation protease